MILGKKVVIFGAKIRPPKEGQKIPCVVLWTIFLSHSHTHDRFLYYFSNEKERVDALKKINGHKWRGIFLKAVVSLNGKCYTTMYVNPLPFRDMCENFRFDPEFRILRLTFHRKSASKS